MRRLQLVRELKSSSLTIRSLRMSIRSSRFEFPAFQLSIYLDCFCARNSVCFSIYPWMLLPLHLHNAYRISRESQIKKIKLRLLETSLVAFFSSMKNVSSLHVVVLQYISRAEYTIPKSQSLCIRATRSGKDAWEFLLVLFATRQLVRRVCSLDRIIKEDGITVIAPSYTRWCLERRTPKTRLSIAMSVFISVCVCVCGRIFKLKRKLTFFR